jgi:hypothetical protein
VVGCVFLVVVLVPLCLVLMTPAPR